MHTIYRHHNVAEVQAHYGNLLYDLSPYSTIKDHLEALAKRMLKGVRKKIPGVLQEINNYHKDYIGWPHDKIIAQDLTLKDCKKGVANLHSFSDWKAIKTNCKKAYDNDFERAVNYLLAGKKQELDRLLSSKPDLVNQRSQYGHRAMLIHYCGSNGVELWRQQVPSNLIEMTQLLIDHGADKAATFNIYGGQFNTIAMVSTSVHPFEADLGEALIELLSA